MNEQSSLSTALKIFSEIKEHASVARQREEQNINAFYLTFKEKSFEEVEEILEKATTNFKGEKIICSISRGRIIDLGREQFEIIRGMVIELYDYATLSSCFLRLYEIREKGKKQSWIACYIDENLLSPWWSEDERKF